MKKVQNTLKRLLTKLGLSISKVQLMMYCLVSMEQSEKPDYVIRLTSDCPLIDPNIIDAVVTFALEHPEYDYVHTDAKSFPDDLDTEVIKFSAIEKAYKEADLKSEREHVTFLYLGTANGGNNTSIALLCPCSHPSHMNSRSM